MDSITWTVKKLIQLWIIVCVWIVPRGTIGAVHTVVGSTYQILTNSYLTNSVLNGDTVVWPSFSNSFSIPFPPITKAIWIKGAGSADSRPTPPNNDATVIYFDNPGSNIQLFNISTPSNIIAAAGFRPRISGMQLRQHSSAGGQNKLIYVRSPVARIDHMRFDNIRKDCIQNVVYGTNGPVSLVDNSSCYTTPSSANANFVRVIGGQANDITTVNQTMGAWAVPPPWGTTNMVVMEDCWVDYGARGNSVADIYASGKICIRYSRVMGTDFGNHGNDSGSYWAALLFEMYNCVFDFKNLFGIPIFGQFRGGTVRISDNSFYFTNPTTHPQINMEVYRASYDTIYPFSNCSAFKPWGMVTGYSTNTAFGFPDGCPPNPMDGQTTWYGYPALGQPGFSGPLVLLTTNSVMQAQPCFQWNNPWYGPHGTTGSVQFSTKNRPNSVGLPTANLLIVEGRDYFNDTPTNYAKLSYPHPWIAVDSAYEALWGVSNAPMFFSTNSPTPPIPPDPPPVVGTNIPVVVTGLNLITPDVVINSEP